MLTYVKVAIGIVAFLGISGIGFSVLYKLGTLISRGARRLREVNVNQDSFEIVCTICQTHNWYKRTGILERLDHPSPMAACGGCMVNLTGPYIDHPEVVRAQMESNKLRTINEMVYTRLNELHSKTQQPALTSPRVENGEEDAQIAKEPEIVYTHKIQSPVKRKPSYTE